MKNDKRIEANNTINKHVTYSKNKNTTRNY